MAVTKIAPLLSAGEVLDRVLDKGLVIEAEVSIAVVGIELVTISALVRIASFETWDRYVQSRERNVQSRGRTHRRPAVFEAPDTHRFRLRCEAGCTFERRASAVLIDAGVLAPQRCAVKRGRRCAVAVV